MEIVCENQMATGSAPERDGGPTATELKRGNERDGTATELKRGMSATERRRRRTELKRTESERERERLSFLSDAL